MISLRRVILSNIRMMIAFVVLFALLFLPDISFYMINRQPQRLIIGWIFVSSIFLLPVIFFHNHIKLYVILLTVVGFFSLLATIPVFYFGLILNEEVMELIYNTSYSEAFELTRSYLIPVIIAILAYAGIAILIVKTVPKTIPRSISWKITVLCAAIVLIITQINNTGHGSYLTNIKSEAYSYYPFYIVYNGKLFYKEVQLGRRHPELVKNFHFDVSLKKRIRKRQVYIFFIGEASRYDHWGINGYGRNTSPLLSKEANLISFRNVCAAGGLTRLSVPILMTQAKPDSFSQHDYEKGILSLFREAGYNTYWISDQVDGANVMMHARGADSLILFPYLLMNEYDTTLQLHYDMDLTTTLKRVIQENTGNLFIVIHSLGSHFSYNLRYPESYNHFRPSGGKSLLIPNDKQMKDIYTNAYDNSILYDDAVIDSAIHILKKSNAVSFLYYISDHGENLDDNSDGLFMHEPHRPTKYIAHIPLFIYTSSAYNHTFHNKVAALNSHVNSRIDGDNTFNTIADMADLRFLHQDTSMSFASPGFKDTTRLILGGDRKVYTYKELSETQSRQSLL